MKFIWWILSDEYSEIKNHETNRIFKKMNTKRPSEWFFEDVENVILISNFDQGITHRK